MTEEIEKQAEEYYEDNEYYSRLSEVEEFEEVFDFIKDRVTQAFQDGAKWGVEHAIEWHDLREDPTNLPKENGEYWGYVNYYGFQHRTIHWSDNQFDITEVIAWCELPTYKE